MAINSREIGNISIFMTHFAESIGLDENAFSIEFLNKHNLITDQKSGRGQVYFFNWKLVRPNQHNNIISYDKTLALRHYRRGGLAAKLSQDSFIYRGLENTRCYQELYILDFLNNNNVNVPKPIAGRVTKQSLLYQADLITEVIEDAIELHEHLSSSAIESTTWQKIGAEIRKMHDLNVCHEDINVKNILIKTQDSGIHVYLIDFDKCLIKKQGNWKEANLARFKRSLNKHKSNYAQGAFTDVNWQELLKGYQSH